MTTSAWDYFVTQGHGVGGINEFNPNCVDWDQALGAGKYGSFGAAESMLTFPLGVPYLAAYLASGGHVTPRDINATTLSYIGLGDEYETALGNPYYFSGQAGGQFAANYISLATLVKGLPTSFGSRQITIGSPNILLNGNGSAVLSPGMTISIPIPVGGNLGLVAVGGAGLTSGYLMMSGNGGGGQPSGQLHHILSNKILGALNKHPTLKSIFNRNDFIVQASSEADHLGYQGWHRQYDAQVTTWLENNPNATRNEFISFLREIYSESQLKQAFPAALDILK